MTIRALIVDDEKLARSRLRRMLSEYPRIEVLGEAKDGAEGARLIGELSPDVVFLDIRMPTLSAFDMLSKLAHPPRIVFVTAYDQYALRAFEENAVDYLLKPVSKERLDSAVERLETLAGCGAGAAVDLTGLLRSIERRESLIKRFSVTVRDRVVLIPDGDIECFGAEGKCTLLHTRDKEYIVPFTMKELEERLDPEVFVRVHRSWIANLEHIESISKWFAGRLLIRTRGGLEITVSRGYVAAFRGKIHL